MAFEQPTYILRGTFINEVGLEAHCEQPGLPRSSSEPRLGQAVGRTLSDRGHAQVERLQRKYVETLGQQASQIKQAYAPGGLPLTVMPQADDFGQDSWTPSKTSTAPSRTLRACDELLVVGEFYNRFSSEASTCMLTSYATEESAGCDDELSTGPLTPQVTSQDPEGGSSASPECKSPDQVAQAWSIGSIGHPGLCKRPCILFKRGECSEGRDCLFCHAVHSARNPHLDKRHRELLVHLSFDQRAAVAVPIMKRQVAKMGLAAEAQGLLNQIEAFANQAPDTPEWLTAKALEKELEKIRGAETPERKRLQ